jgi:hydroxyacylglutathione hydrolase
MTDAQAGDTTVKFHITNDPMFVENGYIVYLRDGGSCWIVDPGLRPQAKEMLAFLDQHGLSVDRIVLTHAHADHIAGIDEILSSIGDKPIMLARGEWTFLTDPNENLSANLGMPITVAASDVHDLNPGDAIRLESTEWRIGDVAGHSPAGRSLYCADQGIVIVGDALFQGSVGRVDFPHSDGALLMKNIHETLMTLPDETRVLSGHGPETTIGRERQTNPYVLHGL